jgi:hypothetical protein
LWQGAPASLLPLLLLLLKSKAPIAADSRVRNSYCVVKPLMMMRNNRARASWPCKSPISYDLGEEEGAVVFLLYFCDQKEQVVTMMVPRDCAADRRAVLRVLCAVRFSSDACANAPSLPVHTHIMSSPLCNMSPDLLLDWMRQGNRWALRMRRRREYPADAAASGAVSFRRLPSNSTSRYPTALGIIQLDKFVMICLNFFHRERPKKKIIL